MDFHKSPTSIIATVGKIYNFKIYDGYKNLVYHIENLDGHYEYISEKDFLDHFGLKKYVTLTREMNAEQIQRAIDLGYEAKMWELTNRIE